MTTFALTRKLEKLQKLQEMNEGERVADNKEIGNPASPAGGAELGMRNEKPIPQSAIQTPNPEAVFTINFLRHEIIPLSVRRTLIFVALAYLAAHVLFLGYLGSVAASSRAEWKKVQAGIQGEVPSAVALADLKTEMATMQENAAKELGELNRIIVRKREEFPFGGKLAALARTLPARTWITALSGDRENRRITIQATYLVNPENPYDHPTKKWIDALKADPSFGSRLKRCDLGASSQKMQGKVEIYSFELVSEWER